MTKENKITIFHLCKKDGSEFFLHPFNDNNIIKLIENNEINGLFGNEPRVEALTMLSNKMYRLIDSAVASWLGDTRFIPKFLISSLVFFITYFFMSFVIRDPIPLLDELLVSIVLSVITFVAWGRRDSKSEIAVNLRLKLKSKIDKVYFEQSSFLKEIEKILKSIDSKDENELISQLIDENFETEKNISFNEEFQKYLELYLSENNIKRLNKKIAAINKSKSLEIKKIRYSLLLKSLEKRNFDFSLFLLYKSLTYSTV